MKIRLSNAGLAVAVTLLSLIVAGCGTTGDSSEDRCVGSQCNTGGGGNGDGSDGNGGGTDGPGGMGPDGGDGSNGGPGGMGPDGGDGGNGGPGGMGPDGGTAATAVPAAWGRNGGNGGPGGMGPDGGGAGDAGDAAGGAASGGTAGEAAAGAADAGPGFGSVTQSSNVGSDGVTTDRARATFSLASGLGLTISRDSGSTLSLNSASHRFNYDTDPNDAVDDFHLFSSSATEFTLARVVTAWTEGDDSDYLAFGYWLHGSGDLENDDVDVRTAEIGAFVDGPELRGTPTLPVSGTATYDGFASGLYSAEAGTDITDVPEGTYEIGEFFGDMELTADFGDETISGSVDNIVLLYYLGVEPDETVYEGSNESTDYELYLGSASIDSNGQFTGSDVTLRHPFLDFQPATGSWGGRFSTLDVNDNGIPDVVGGTAGGTASTSGGSTITFVGGYFGGEPE